MESQTWVSVVPVPECTFIITTPTNDRITVNAGDFQVNDGCLYFFSNSDVGVYALAAGHWVRVERDD